MWFDENINTPEKLMDFVRKMRDDKWLCYENNLRLALTPSAREIYDKAVEDTKEKALEEVFNGDDYKQTCDDIGDDQDALWDAEEMAEMEVTEMCDVANANKWLELFSDPANRTEEWRK